MTFYFDMDGTIADLYGIDGWLEDLRAEKVRPYAEARPLVDCSRLMNDIKKLCAEGYKFGIISWTSKTGTPEYNKAVRAAKLKWLSENLPGCFTEIHIVKYGTPKHKVAKDKGFLFDDEAKNREKWDRGESFDETQIFVQLEW